MAPRRVNNAVFEFMAQMQEEVVMKSGDPRDKYHLGKLVLKAFRDHPKAISQIDGGTGESESNASVLARSARLASCLRSYGLERGDVIALMAPNHVDLCVPFYAALYLGLIVMAVDRTLALRELTTSFEIGKPKIIFCQSEKAPDIQLALNEIDLNSLIVTFDRGDYLCSFSDFIEKYADEDFDEETFEASELDGADTTAFIIATSGTTGLPKAAAVTHKNFAISGPYLWSKYTQFPTPTAVAMICSPLQWLTAIMNFLYGAIFTYTRLQSSKTMTQQHCYELINKYRAVTAAEVNDIFGMSELAGVGFLADGVPPPGSCGKPIGCLQYRLMSTDTGEEIFEPFVSGELWLRGPGIFKEYYDNPEATEESFAEGRWFKTGDLLYRDATFNYFYVDRIKLMLKYKSFHVSPVELENVIRTHEDVVDAAVTGLPDPACGDLVVGCIVRRAGSQLTAQDIKDLVKNTLSDAKQLRGGVIFLDEIPTTASTKVHRRKLKEMALTMERE